MVIRATVNMKQPRPQFPAIVVATVFKPSQGTRAGIAFSSSGSDGRIRISTLSNGGLFSETDLRVGDACLAINGSADLPSHVEAAQAVRRAAGEVTITVARGTWSPDVVLATVSKRDVGTKTGVVFAEGPNRTVRIKRTVTGSLFERTELQGGDIVHSVNGVAADDVTQAANLVRASKGTATIVAYSLAKARIQAVEFVFHRDYDIEWTSADECEVSHTRLAGHARFVLLFSSEQNTATYLDVSKGSGGAHPKISRDIKIEFARKLLLLNDILANARDVVSMAASPVPTVPVLAELIEEPETSSHGSLMNDLERLASLRREGLLSESEFGAAKGRLLGLVE